ncbi:MAG: NAD(P)/FAD-dependent oxidoreductase [Actinomycetota bacterium]|nr:NAD(P)/FAD-dependent oxidoreductase [Actinomycetota bacterium]
MSEQRQRTVIVGAGFAGLWAAKTLAGAPIDVVVVDRNNYHSFFPLLYQVAAAELEPGDIAYPVRTILRRQDNAYFKLAEVQGLELDRKVVLTNTGPVPYEYLILGLGSTTQYFGVDGAEDHAFSLRTLDEAVALRNHILRSFEAAEHAADMSERSRHLTFAIVGGGPTGVEFAGALQELINGPIAKDHHRIDPADVSVILVEASPGLLSIYPDRLAAYARRRLTKMGVDVRTEMEVTAVDASGVALGDGTRIDSSTVVWTAGVGGDPIVAGWGLPTSKGGRVPVLSTLQLEGYPEVFVTGDLALPQAAGPMIAQNALQQGTQAARNILHLLADEAPQPYKYHDLGNMAVIGRNAAVVHLRSRWAFKGFPAWVMWLTVHLFKLIGFRNRAAAVLSWTGDYLFGDRTARVILEQAGSGTRGDSNPQTSDM